MPPTTHLELPVICGTPAFDDVVATVVLATVVLPGLLDVASVGAEVTAGV